MKLNVRFCVSLAILSVAMPTSANSFNTVIEDFDSYMQSEEQIEVTKPRDTQPDTQRSRFLNKSSSDLYKTTAPKKVTENKAVVSQPKKVKQEALKESRQYNQNIGNKSAQENSVNTVLPQTDVSYIEIPVYSLQSASVAISPFKWSPQFLLRDFDKYTLSYSAFDIFNQLNAVSSRSTDDNKFIADLLSSLTNSPYLVPVKSPSFPLILGEFFSRQLNWLKDKEFTQPLIIANTKLNQLTIRLAEQTKDYQALKDQYAQLQAQLNEKEASYQQNSGSNNEDILALENEIKQLTEQLANNQEKLKALDIQLTESNSAKNKLEAALDKQKSDEKTIAQTQQQLNDNAEKLAAELTLSKQNLIESQQKNAEQLALLEKQLQAKETENNDKVRSLVAAQQNIAKLEKTLAEQAKQITATGDEKVALLNQQFEQSKKQFEQEKKQADADKKQLETKITDLQKEITSLTDINKKAGIESAALLANLQQNLAQAEKQKTEIASSTDKQVSEIKNQLAQSQKQEQEYQRNLKLLETDKQTAQKSLAEKEIEIANLQKEIAALTNKNKQTSAESAAMLADLQQKLVQAEQQKTELVASSTDKQVIDIKDQLAQVQQQAQEYQRNLKLLETDKQTVQKSLAEKEIAIANLQKEIATLTTANKKSITESAAIILLQQKLTDLEKQKSTVQAELTTAQSKIQQLENSVKDNKANLAVADKTNTDVSAFNKQIEEQQKIIAQTNLDLQKAKDDLAEAKKQIADKSDLNNGLDKKEEELNKYKTLAEKTQKDNEELSKKLQAAIAELKRIENEAFIKMGIENKAKNKQIIASLKKEKANKADKNTYYKVITQGKNIVNIRNKTITFIMTEELTGGQITVMYDKKKPVILPYRELPPRLGSFIEKVGVGGKVKIYMTPEASYGVEGVEGQIPPNSMSFIELEVLDAK